MKGGGVAVIPTDTIYGLVGQALSRETVKRIYDIKKRTPEKPFIILISDVKDLKLFEIEINKFQKLFIERYWPGEVSVALSSKIKDLKYLDRGTNSLAFRLPDNVWLREIIKITGPLVAPSANPEGKDPAIDIKKAKKYFDKKVDYYFERGTIECPPSTLVLLEKNQYTVLRQGITTIG